MPNVCIVYSMLAEKLNMTPEDAEKWIVNLIRNATLDAKIDSKEVGYALENMYDYLPGFRCVINRTSIVKCECIYDFYSDVASNPWQQEHRDTILSH